MQRDEMMRAARRQTHPGELLLKKSLDQFSWDELEHLVGLLNSNRFREIRSIKWAEGEQDREEKYLAAKARREAKKKEEKALEKYLKAFVRSRLCIGDLVTFSGTNGSSKRQVASFTEYNISGMVVGRTELQEGGKLVPKLTGYVSTNGIGKLSGWWDRFEGCWRDRDWIVEEGRKILSAQ
jgi:hypothetical protein